MFPFVTIRTCTAEVVWTTKDPTYVLPDKRKSLHSKAGNYLPCPRFVFAKLESMMVIDVMFKSVILKPEDVVLATRHKNSNIMSVLTYWNHFFQKRKSGCFIKSDCKIYTFVQQCSFLVTTLKMHFIWIQKYNVHVCQNTCTQYTVHVYKTFARFGSQNGEQNRTSCFAKSAYGLF